ncbi:hypothetical protein CWC31_02490 [Pseudoalteromonas ruthenica]|uniref:head completion/stabilization protein n=1 Tax=Pseudoalteromonas ruthenica TaxID=151081 RepID=UPI001109E167|nr:head completion/stabilization protein [Pseudoalteromonas ruthenica]TLX52037.1 hypothetical protein CWC31_02490 [Pseudoalteromonas ruthenica]
MSFSGINSTTNDQVIANNGFYPAVSVQQFAELYHVPSSYREAMVVDVLTHQVHALNAALERDYVLHWEQYPSLAEVPSEHINGQSALVYYYIKALSCFAKADLLLSHQSISQRESALAEKEQQTEHRAYWLNEGIKARNYLVQSKYRPVELL